MIHLRVRDSTGAVRADAAPDELHGLIENHENLIWIDLESPTAEELEVIAGIAAWNRFNVEDMVKQGQRAKLEQADGYSFVVTHALNYNRRGTPRLTTPEIDVVVGPNYVATVHYAALDHLTEYREHAPQTEAMLANGRDFLLYVLADRLVDTYFPIMDAMLEAVDDLEDTIVSDPTPALMSRIFEMKHDGITLRKVISPQLEVFSRLAAPGYGIVRDEHQAYFRDVHDHLIRVFEAMESYRELMGGALDAYLSNVSNRMNEVMKRLTIIAALFLPISFITGLLGMNLREVPLWKDNLFWLFLLIMAAISAAQLYYFRRKGWV